MTTANPVSKWAESMEFTKQAVLSTCTDLSLVAEHWRITADVNIHDLISLCMTLMKKGNTNQASDATNLKANEVRLFLGHRTAWCGLS